MLHYPCVERHCRKAGDELHIPMKNVFPVSNYHDEGSTTPTKNAMALNVLWKIVGLCINHIENHQYKGDVLDGFYE
ncbi:hypothetical protein MHBO_004773 [Bonamia ostreae]|uniref:Uncharacterized protein n=1 Tax=Bonamia ostreae TaxID=126728 RepID=A0ABV2AUW1_9EUKA